MRCLWLLPVLLFASAGAVGCNCVAFKFSQVQDYWLTGVQRAVMDVFKENLDPVTVGIIGGPSSFGNDASLVNYVRTSLSTAGWRLDVANNGKDFEDFSALTSAQQQALLSQSNSNLVSKLGVPPPKVFMPPMEAFNQETTAALLALNFTLMSAATFSDPPPYPLTGQTFYRFPSGASTSSPSNYNVGVEYQATLGDLQAQLNTYGFAVVSLFPQVYAVKDASGEPTEAVDQGALTQLRNLLQAVKNANIAIVNLKEIGSTPLVSTTGAQATTRAATSAQSAAAQATSAQSAAAQATSAQSAAAQATTRAASAGVATTAAAATTGGSSSAPVVAFRLDDIQDYWITSAQQEVINTFKREGVPLSIGIIANFFGTDSQIVAAVNSALSTLPEVEATCHGYSHEDFTTKSYSEQLDLLTQSRTKIQAVTGKSVTTFIPPFNSVNSDTFLACKAVGYTHVSSEVDQDPPSYSFSSKGIWRFPIKAATAVEDSRGASIGIPYETTFSQIQAQIASYGFSAVMLHPQEFSKLVNGQLINEVNATQVEQLTLLLRQVKAAGYRTTVLGKINTLFAPA